MEESERERVLAEARELLRAGESVAAIVARFPAHADELAQLLPAAAALQSLGRTAARERAREGAMAAYTKAFAPAAAPATIAQLLRHDRTESGLTVDQQAQRMGLSAGALQALEAEATPVAELDPMGIKRLAEKVRAPFAALVKEVRRLTSLAALQNLGSAAPVFTRGPQSGDSERQELLAIVRRARQARPGAGS